MLKRRGEAGQGMTEYIIIVAVIALVAIAGVKIFGEKIKAMFVNQANQLEQETGSTGPANGQ